MFKGGYHIILVPENSQKTKRLRVSKLTARLFGFGSFLVIPVIALSLFSTIQYQKKIVALKRHMSEDGQVLQEKEELMARLAALEESLAQTEKNMGKLESALDIELGEMQHGLGPIEQDTPLGGGLKAPSEILSAAKALEEGDGFKVTGVKSKMSELDHRIAGMHSKVDEIYELNSDKIRFLNATPDTMPVDGWITSGFGFRHAPFTGIFKMHYGIDIASPTGTPVKATAPGKVLVADYKGGYGRKVVIDHGYGVTTTFGHASEIFVKEGEVVKKGDVIAAVGSTGSSTGPHLHYEVHVDGIPADPMNYLIK